MLFFSHSLYLFELLGLLTCCKCFLVIHVGGKTMQIVQHTHDTHIAFNLCKNMEVLEGIQDKTGI